MNAIVAKRREWHLKKKKPEHQSGFACIWQPMKTKHRAKKVNDKQMVQPRKLKENHMKLVEWGDTKKKSRKEWNIHVEENNQKVQWVKCNQYSDGKCRRFILSVGDSFFFLFQFAYTETWKVSDSHSPWMQTHLFLFLIFFLPIIIIYFFFSLQTWSYSYLKKKKLSHSAQVQCVRLWHTMTKLKILISPFFLFLLCFHILCLCRSPSAFLCICFHFFFCAWF